MSEVYDRYVDTAGNEHFTDVETGHHVIPTVCGYCHEDRDGYVIPLEKNCHAYFVFPNEIAIFDCFGIEDGNFNVNTYIGKIGGCQVKHDDDGRARVQYFLSKKQQESLPAWQGETPVFTPVGEEEELPF